MSPGNIMSRAVAGCRNGRKGWSARKFLVAALPASTDPDTTRWLGVHFAEGKDGDDAPDVKFVEALLLAHPNPVDLDRSRST